MCQPERVVWCDGSEHEYQDDAAADGPGRAPRSRLDRERSARTASSCAPIPADVARVEEFTFICSRTAGRGRPDEQLARPGRDEGDAARALHRRDEGPHDVRDPVQHGPDRLADREDRRRDHRLALRGREHAPDGARRARACSRRSARTANSCAGCTRSGAPLGDRAAGRRRGRATPKTKYICHFPETREIWSYGSGYGGNALLGKKCHALRIASVQARDEGWLAEHMLILGITNPEGKKIFIAAAFPSACGKTNLAMLNPTLPGWKVETVGDDIAWMKFGADGRLYAINPEAGFFGVAPGTSMKTQSRTPCSRRRRTRSSRTARSRPTATCGGRR